MGIYDRDYYRQERPQGAGLGPRSAVGILIVANIVVYVADWVLSDGRLTERCALTVGTLSSPWEWWQFLTYGFLHAKQPQHIVLNMLGLFFLGRDVEDLYGKKEFFRVYLAMVVFGGLAWAVVEKFLGTPASQGVVGASGAISGIVILYALNFPRRMLALFFVIPVPAWFAGVLVVVLDAYGAVTRDPGNRVAYMVHIGGAALALAYYGLGWNFGRLWPKSFSLRWLRPRPKLRVHTPDDPDDQAEEDLSDEVDRILEKISREGETSLTREERRTLESASRQYQKRRQGSSDRVP